MALQTIIEPTADQKQLDVYNRRMKRANTATVATGAKCVLVLLELGGDANLTDYNYKTIATDIAKVAGVSNVEMLINVECPATIPEGKELRMICEAHLRIDDAPEE